MFMSKIFVDGVLLGHNISFGQLGRTVAASDPTKPLFIGKEAYNNNPIQGIVGDVDNLRLWNEQRNQLDIRWGMHAHVDGQTPGLVAQWQVSQALSKMKAEALTGSSTADRQLKLFGDHRLRKSVIVGPLIWRVCPGANNKPLPQICTVNGRCKIGNRRSAMCKCDRGFFGRACEVGCPNARGKGGPCHVDWGWGVCVFDAIAYTATCNCKEGFMGDACQYPCPGLGVRYAKKIGRSCDNRGECYFTPAVAIPKTIAEANALADKVLTGPGVGAVTINKNHKVHKGAYDWKRFSGIPGKIAKGDTKALETVQKTIEAQDHDAQCACNNPELTHGEACHVLCPANNNKICWGRGKPAMRIDPWDGPQMHSHMYGIWYGVKEGCKWELHQTQVTEYKAVNKKTWYRDTPGVAAVPAVPADVRVKELMKRLKQRMKLPWGGRRLLASRKVKAKGKAHKKGQVQEGSASSRGIMALCRCWAEVGYHAHQENCAVECAGANWEGTGQNVCGGPYKFGGANARYPETGM